MITLYSNNQLYFLKAAYDAKVIHERNGRLDLEFKIPLKDDYVYSRVKRFDIVETTIPAGPDQKFYINKIVKKQSYIHIYAKHIFFLLEKNVVKDITSSNVNANTIMQRFKAALQVPTQFTFTSNITDQRQFNIKGFDNALKVLAEGKHSILGQWGGVLELDNYNIALNKRIGRDTDYLIAKRKNINDIEIDVDVSDVVTRLIVYKYIEVEGEEDLLRYSVVDSPLINEYPDIYVKEVEITDEDINTNEELSAAGMRIFNNDRIDLPKENFKVDVTNQLNDYHFSVDDTAIILYEDYYIDKRIMVVAYEYDPTVKKYINVTFGEKPKSLLQTTTEKITENVEDALMGVSGVNEHGSWTKLYDGTLICYSNNVKLKVESEQERPVNSGIYTNLDYLNNIQFPVKFKGKPFVDIKMHMAEEINIANRIITETYVNPKIYKVGSGMAGKTYEGTLFAIGRWK